MAAQLLEASANGKTKLETRMVITGIAAKN